MLFHNCLVSCYEYYSKKVMLAFFFFFVRQFKDISLRTQKLSCSFCVFSVFFFKYHFKDSVLHFFTLLSVGVDIVLDIPLIRLEEAKLCNRLVFAILTNPTLFCLSLLGSAHYYIYIREKMTSMIIKPKFLVPILKNA